ncbi:MAG TPA: pilus assembly protein PilM [Candidatus Omnitrophota bacterium]|nr:pilus assembly protein PilM [Candidatus Omnitrophota bacterium]HPT39482.1 pilus assembly protein PilM [Candidatus Omnitrophota bacterium]
MFKFNMDNLKLLSGLTNQELVGVNFNGNSLKISHIKISPNRKEVVNLLNLDITALNDIDIAKAIQVAIGALRGRKVEIVDVVPTQLVITKNIEIPSIDKKEIKEILNLQAGRHTPYSREEIIVDYVEIGTYKHSYTKVLLVIVARSVVKRHYEILDRAGFKLKKALLASEGMALAISKTLRLETDNAPVNILHVDENFTDFSIVLKNKVIFIRSIPIGTSQLKNEKEVYQIKFVDELKRSLEAYLGGDIEISPHMLILTGAEEELKEIESLLNNTLHLPVKTMPYANIFGISELARGAMAKFRQLSFFDVIAPILNCGEMKIDLIPEEARVRRSIEERGKDLIKTGIFILSILIVTFFILTSKIYFKGAQLNKLESRYATINQEAKKLEKDLLKVGLVKNYLTNRGYSLEILTELHSLVSEDIELSEIRYDGDKFSVKGTANAMSSVFSFVDLMEKSKYFKEVKTRYTTKRKDGLRDLTDFEIVAQTERPQE